MRDPALGGRPAPPCGTGRRPGRRRRARRPPAPARRTARRRGAPPRGRRSRRRARRRVRARTRAPRRPRPRRCRAAARWCRAPPGRRRPLATAAAAGGPALHQRSVRPSSDRAGTRRGQALGQSASAGSRWSGRSTSAGAVAVERARLDEEAHHRGRRRDLEPAAADVADQQPEPAARQRPDPEHVAAAGLRARPARRRTRPRGRRAGRALGDEARRHRARHAPLAVVGVRVGERRRGRPGAQRGQAACDAAGPANPSPSGGPRGEHAEQAVPPSATRHPHLGPSRSAPARRRRAPVPPASRADRPRAVARAGPLADLLDASRPPDLEPGSSVARDDPRRARRAPPRASSSSDALERERGEVGQHPRDPQVLGARTPGWGSERAIASTPRMRPSPVRDRAGEERGRASTSPTAAAATSGVEALAQAVVPEPVAPRPRPRCARSAPGCRSRSRPRSRRGARARTGGRAPGRTPSRTASEANHDAAGLDVGVRAQSTTRNETPVTSSRRRTCDDDLLERPPQPCLRPRGVLDAALLQHEQRA